MSHQYPTIKTVDELRAFMTATSIKEVVSHADIIWFVCLYNARVVSEAYSLKDIAAMFSEGVAKIDTMHDVQEFLNSLYEEFTECNALQNEINTLTLVAQVLDFYCKHEEHAQVLELIETIGIEE